MMKMCTWEGCVAEATEIRVETNVEGTKGGVWATLCLMHSKHLNAAEATFLEGGGPAQLLRCWIKAQGGAKKATARLMR